MLHISEKLPLLKSPQPKTKKVVSPNMKKSDPIQSITPTEAFKPRFKSETPEFCAVEIDPKDWIIRQTTAVCGIRLEDYIIPENMVKYINENGNSWSRDDIRKYYKTFIGGHNFFDHDQEIKNSYGFLADAVMRKIDVGNNGDYIIYVDVITCTNKNQSPNMDNLRRIESNEINTLSMGCQSDAVRCSQCGTVSSTSENDCKHLRRQIGRKFIAPKGAISKTSAIVWANDEEGNSEMGIDFIELSWVGNPAYRGATASFDLNGFEDKDKIYFKIPTTSVYRKDGFDAIPYWESKGELKIIKGV